MARWSSHGLTDKAHVRPLKQKQCGFPLRKRCTLLSLVELLVVDHYPLIVVRAAVLPREEIRPLVRCHPTQQAVGRSTGLSRRTHEHSSAANHKTNGIVLPVFARRLATLTRTQQGTDRGVRRS